MLMSIRLFREMVELGTPKKERVPHSNLVWETYFNCQKQEKDLSILRKLEKGKGAERAKKSLVWSLKSLFRLDFKLHGSPYTPS